MSRTAARGTAGGAPGRVRLLEHIADVEAAAWNRLAGDAQPFLRHEFLAALEASGCVAPERGWTPRHLLVEDAAGRVIGALPLYEKSHSRGEFVFDFAWANAYHAHGLAYYPKLLTAVPFTPVRGDRLLCAPDADGPVVRAALIGAVRQLARESGLSSWHVLFPQDAELEVLGRAGLVRRLDCQFHWFNRGYDSFDAFLAGFNAEKRKKAKRERRRVAEAGIRFETRAGEEIDAPLWKTLYGFYADTFHRHGHEPYLDLAFFRRVARALPGSLMLKIARRGAEPIAVAIFFVGRDALYGRYWGANDQYHSLHFETCYYQGIEWCIEHQIGRFEPGTQGEHKVPRGFVPTLMGSAHAILDPRFERAIRDFAEREARAVRAYAAEVDAHVPYRQPDPELLV